MAIISQCECVQPLSTLHLRSAGCQLCLNNIEEKKAPGCRGAQPPPWRAGGAAGGCGPRRALGKAQRPCQQGRGEGPEGEVGSGLKEGQRRPEQIEAG